MPYGIKSREERNTVVDQNGVVLSTSEVCRRLNALEERVKDLESRENDTANQHRYEGAAELLDSVAGKYSPKEISTKVCLVLANNLENIRLGQSLT